VNQPGDPLPRPETAGGYGTRYAHHARSILNVIVGLSAFVATCLLLHALLPFPHVPEVSPKLRFFNLHKDEFDTVFIGSSHIYRHVVPETFDRSAVGGGVPTRSFNFGLPGMHPPESFYVLDQILRDKPSGLKWVFVELEEVYPLSRHARESAPRPRTRSARRTNQVNENAGTRRFLYWHNPALTWMAVRKSLNANGPRAWWKNAWFVLRSKTVRLHLAVCLKNLANIGAAQDFEEIVTNSSESKAEQDHLAQQRGFEPRPENMPPSDFSRYREELAKYAAKSEPRLLDPISEAAYREFAQRIRDHGATVIFIVPPLLDQSDLRFRNEADVGARVLAFNKANLYPTLYDPRVHADREHLRFEGAQTFTRFLAERFIAEVASSRR